MLNCFVPYSTLYMAERKICACLCSVTACSFVLKKSRKEEKKNWNIEEPRKYSLWNSDFSKKKERGDGQSRPLKKSSPSFCSFWSRLLFPSPGVHHFMAKKKILVNLPERSLLCVERKTIKKIYLCFSSGVVCNHKSEDAFEIGIQNNLQCRNY